MMLEALKTRITREPAHLSISLSQSRRWVQQGFNNTASAWTPRGALNLLIENTYFFNQPDGTWSEGLTGTASPYPISVQNQRSYNSFPRVYLDESTNYDVTYYMGNSIVGNPDNFIADEYVTTTIG